MSGYKKNKPFGIVFSPTNQPGWESRMGAPMRTILGKDAIVGTEPKSHPEPFSDSQVVSNGGNLREKFISMQVPALMPSRQRYKKKV